MGSGPNFPRAGKFGPDPIFLTPSLRRHRQNASHGTEIPMDLTYLLLAAGLIALTFGLGLLCGRLLERKP